MKLSGLACSDGAKGGRPPYDPVIMFMVLILAAQKDTDARWTVNIGRPRHPTAERSVPEMAIAVFGYRTHVAIDQAFGFIRSWTVTSAARHDGAALREIITADNAAASVWG